MHIGTLGSKVRDRRLELGMTQPSLVDRLTSNHPEVKNWKVVWISRLETNKIKMRQSKATLAALSETLELSDGVLDSLPMQPQPFVLATEGPRKGTAAQLIVLLPASASVSEDPSLDLAGDLKKLHDSFADDGIETVIVVQKSSSKERYNPLIFCLTSGNSETRAYLYLNDGSFICETNVTNVLREIFKEERRLGKRLLK